MEDDKNQKKGKGFTVIIKPTLGCNLACSYCYEDSNPDKNETMSEETLTNSIQKVTEFNSEGPTSFLWHGGEPMLPGIDFYKRVVSIQAPLKEKGYEIDNSMQSNATLITDEILDFFEKYGFHIGASLDGPKKIHDKSRRYAGNNGSSFDDSFQNILKLKERNIGGGAIVVLTKENIEHLPEIYEFFRDNDIPVKINHIINLGRARSCYENIGISAKEYGEAMCNLFDLWFYDEIHNLSVDPFDEIIGNIMTDIPRGCNNSFSCQESFFGIEPNGEVYPCGKFGVGEEFLYGNINTDSIEQIMSSDARKKILERSDNLNKVCKACDYLNICNGGCPEEAYNTRGNIYDRNPFCSGYRTLFSHIREAVVSELKKAENKIDEVEV